MLAPVLHLVHGEKGGVGKSFFCRLMVESCIEKQYDFYIVDTDVPKCDVGRFYDALKKSAQFTENERRSNKVDTLYSWALEKPVIVNLPAKVQVPLGEWFERNDLLVDVAAGELSVFVWFVSSGEPDSLEFFKESVASFDFKVPHILVQNHGGLDVYTPNWEAFSQNSSLVSFCEQHSIRHLVMSSLHPDDAGIIINANQRFVEALKDKSLDQFAVRRIHRYLRKFSEQILSLGAVNDADGGVLIRSFEAFYAARKQQNEVELEASQQVAAQQEALAKKKEDEIALAQGVN